MKKKALFMIILCLFIFSVYLQTTYAEETDYPLMRENASKVDIVKKNIPDQEKNI